MALITPSFDEVQDTVVPGTYKCMIKKGELKEYATGTKYVNWELETFGEADPKNNGRRIYHTTPIEGKGAFLLQQTYLAAIGQALTGGFDTEQLVGKQVGVEVIDDVRDGEPTGYTKVKRVKRLNM
jgi:hypothetical protein